MKPTTFYSNNTVGEIIYLSKDKTGLPFDIVKDSHFENYSAKWDNGAKSELSISDLINVHVLLEARRTAGHFSVQ
jgi:hypothetical protein